MPKVKHPDGTIEYIANAKQFKAKYGFGGSEVDDADYYILPWLEYRCQVLNHLLETSFFHVLEKLGHLAIFPAIVLFVLSLLGIGFSGD